jgi:hypothetical protein
MPPLVAGRYNHACCAVRGALVVLGGMKPGEGLASSVPFAINRNSPFLNIFDDGANGDANGDGSESDDPDYCNKLIEDLIATDNQKGSLADENGNFELAATADYLPERLAAGRNSKIQVVDLTSGEQNQKNQNSTFCVFYHFLTFVFFLKTTGVERRAKPEKPKLNFLRF